MSLYGGIDLHANNSVIVVWALGRQGTRKERNVRPNKLFPPPLSSGGTRSSNRCPEVCLKSFHYSVLKYGWVGSALTECTHSSTDSKCSSAITVADKERVLKPLRLT